jgi:hypothetical protein
MQQDNAGLINRLRKPSGPVDFDPTRHFYRFVYHINRDKLFEALFKKLAE